MKVVIAFVKNFIIYAIRMYQTLISPLLGPRCRFYPSCSEYGKVCFQRYGLLKALSLTARRVVRCHPWHPGGIDLP